MCASVFQQKNPTSLSDTHLPVISAALASLTSSAVNVAVLVAMPNEPGWVCMACCVADVRNSLLHPYTFLTLTVCR